MIPSYFPGWGQPTKCPARQTSEPKQGSAYPTLMGCASAQSGLAQEEYHVCLKEWTQNHLLTHFLASFPLYFSFNMSKVIYASACKWSWESFLEMSRLCCFSFSVSFPCGTLNLFKLEVPTVQTHGRKLLKHVQIGKQNMLDLTERAGGIFKLSITYLRVWVQTQTPNFNNPCLLAPLFTNSERSYVSW